MTHLFADALLAGDRPSDWSGARSQDWWSHGIWLVRSDLFDKSAFADSLERIYVVESVSIADPWKAQKGYCFDAYVKDLYPRSPDKWGSSSLQIHLESWDTFPETLTSMFEHNVITIAPGEVRTYRRPKLKPAQE